MLKHRASGVLLHIASLPSTYGIGDMGEMAYTFADKLIENKQQYWQLLPLNPSNPSSGESPYFSSSAFAGNPLLIDLNALIDSGLIVNSDITVPKALPEVDIDYLCVREFKLAALNKAYEAFLSLGNNKKFNNFCTQHASWLDDYALFTAISTREKKASWSEWPLALRDRHKNAIDLAKRELQHEIQREKVIQFFFFEQWDKLKRYCNERGLFIFGDMPIYVSYESADVWVNSDLFKLNEDKRPIAVSGVPPDYFSATGQLWNNPVYNWNRLKETSYSWWIARMGALFERFDLVRIDHFRGLIQYWEVPASEETAIKGTWEDVPSYEFFDTLKKTFTDFPVVVEDLGIITPDVETAKKHYNFPGMLIIQFAFGEDGNSSPYLPNNHTENAVVYLGTHDNNTARGWYEDEIDNQTKQRLLSFIDASDDIHSVMEQLIDLTLASSANTAIITAQDLLCLPSRARINDPSDNFGNWTWRLTQEEFDRLPIARLGQRCQKYNRA